MRGCGGRWAPATAIARWCRGSARANVPKPSGRASTTRRTRPIRSGTEPPTSVRGWQETPVRSNRLATRAATTDGQVVERLLSRPRTCVDEVPLWHERVLLTVGFRRPDLRASKAADVPRQAVDDLHCHEPGQGELDVRGRRLQSREPHRVLRGAGGRWPTHRQESVPDSGQPGRSPLKARDLTQ